MKLEPIKPLDTSSLTQVYVLDSEVFIATFSRKSESYRIDVGAEIFHAPNLTFLVYILKSGNDYYKLELESLQEEIQLVELAQETGGSLVDIISSMLI